MNTLIELRIAYWRRCTTYTPCPEPLCGAKPGEPCAGSFDPVVHLARLRAWTHRTIMAKENHAV